MVTFEDLRKIHLLSDLEDSALGRLLPFVQVQIFSRQAVIFKEGQPAEEFYMLLKGKVLLEVTASDNADISLGSVKPGYSFGWSALLPGSSYTSHALCIEPCEVLTISADKLLDILDDHPAIGYQVMKGIVGVLESRLRRRTEQLLKTLRSHPDIGTLISAPDGDAPAEGA